MTAVRTGLDLLVAESFASWHGLKVGAIVNPTSVDARLRHLADLISNAAGVTLAALFGPEHGIRGDAQDMIAIDSAIDSRTNVPVHSLYGREIASLSPRPEWLAGLDLLVFDLQDVGSRYYTFIWTMLYAMRVAAGIGLRFVVLDRPNPIGGVRIEGPSIQPGFESFVGAHPVPIRHGMTVGELARLFRSECRLDLELEVVPCAGYHRSMTWSETGLPWVSPSPNMPTTDTGSVYPGGCLLEGTNLSEGRGTTRPFELWGAPWLDGHALAAVVQREDSGVRYRPCAFQPTFHKFAGRVCHGVQPHVTDPARYRPIAEYTALISAARSQAPERFNWRTEAYEFVAEPIAIDLLFGSSRERLALDQAIPALQIAEAWASDENDFRERRAPFLLYSP
jgi:uncharacterized protein YbbC (DUF1343 family)